MAVLKIIAWADHVQKCKKERTLLFDVVGLQVSCFFVIVKHRIFTWKLALTFLYTAASVFVKWSANNETSIGIWQAACCLYISTSRPCYTCETVYPQYNNNNMLLIFGQIWLNKFRKNQWYASCYIQWSLLWELQFFKLYIEACTIACFNMTSTLD